MLKRVFTSSVTAYVIITLFFAVSLEVTHASDQREARRVAATVKAIAVQKAAVLAQTAAVQSADIHANCLEGVRDWMTFERVIDAAFRPPSQAGKPLTADQIAALAAYRMSLAASIGPRPVC